MAELVDALASGASGGNPVEVQLLFRPPRSAGQAPRSGRCPALQGGGSTPLSGTKNQVLNLLSLIINLKS